MQWSHRGQEDLGILNVTKTLSKYLSSHGGRKKDMYYNSNLAAGNGQPRVFY